MHSRVAPAQAPRLGEEIIATQGRKTQRHRCLYWFSSSGFPSKKSKAMNFVGLLFGQEGSGTIALVLPSDGRAAWRLSVALLVIVSDRHGPSPHSQSSANNSLQKSRIFVASNISAAGGKDLLNLRPSDPILFTRSSICVL